MIVCLYIDDTIFIGSNPSLFQEFKRVTTKFEMIDIRLIAYYLSVKVKQKKEDIFIFQESNTKKILKKFKMNERKPITTPMEYRVKLSKCDKGERVDPTLFTYTRPDILYVVGLVSCYMETSTIIHFNATKRIICYRKGIINFGLL